MCCRTLDTSLIRARSECPGDALDNKYRDTRHPLLPLPCSCNRQQQLSMFNILLKFSSYFFSCIFDNSTTARLFTFSYLSSKRGVDPVSISSALGAPSSSSSSNISSKQRHSSPSMGMLQKRHTTATCRQNRYLANLFRHALVQRFDGFFPWSHVSCSAHCRMQ